MLKKFFAIASVVFLAGVVSAFVWLQIEIQSSGHQPTKAQATEQRANTKERHVQDRAFGNWVTHDAAGFFTLWLVIVGALQLGLFAWQLLYMSKGVKDASVAANAAKDASIAARQTVETMERNARIQLRAYLVAEPFKVIDFEPDKITSAKIAIRNVGQTPAHDVIMATTVEVAKHPLLPIEYPTLKELQNEPNSREGFFANEITVTKEAKRYFSQPEIDDVIKTEARLYIGGRIYYKDVFQADHHTDFLFMCYGENTRTMNPLQCEKGNKAT